MGDCPSFRFFAALIIIQIFVVVVVEQWIGSHLSRNFNDRVLLIWYIFFIGGGFALSDATQESGLSDWIGQQLTGLSVLPPFVIMLIICIITATITEVASNTATANILLPILADTVHNYIFLIDDLFHH